MTMSRRRVYSAGSLRSALKLWCPGFALPGPESAGGRINCLATSRGRMRINHPNLPDLPNHLLDGSHLQDDDDLLHLRRSPVVSPK